MKVAAVMISPRARRPGVLLWGLSGLVAVSAQAALVAPELERSMASRGTHADTAVILRMAGPLDPRPLAVTDRRARDNRLAMALKVHASRSRATLEPQLIAMGARRLRDLWLIHAVAASVPAVAVRQLAGMEGIDRIDLDAFVQQGRTQRTPAPRTPASATGVTALPAQPPLRPEPVPTGQAAAPDRHPPGWNLSAVQAPDLWALGHRGRGVVVASMDTGVDLANPALARQWRGGTNSWYDAHHEEPLPYDAIGHGTQALGVVLGGSGLGVAPEARWIAAKLFDADGRARMSDIHLAFQWLMDPDGDPSTVDAPDVVNASWALTGRGAGTCVTEFAADILALRSAGIAVVFAAGNDGPSPRTSSSPGNNPQTLSVGAVDRRGGIARQTSRGPSACDGGIFPQLVAPGVDVRTADVSYGGLPSTTGVSGSSLAAPHVAGVLALLASAYPSASVAELEAALLRGALDLGPAGADNDFGHGQVQALASLRILETMLAQRAGPSGVPRSETSKVPP